MTSPEHAPTKSPEPKPSTGPVISVVATLDRSPDDSGGSPVVSGLLGTTTGQEEPTGLEKAVSTTTDASKVMSDESSGPDEDELPLNEQIAAERKAVESGLRSSRSLAGHIEKLILAVEPKHQPPFAMALRELLDELAAIEQELTLKPDSEQQTLQHLQTLVVRRQKTHATLDVLVKKVTPATRLWNAAGNVPASWKDFKAEHHGAFLKALTDFRGDDDLHPDTDFRGGEGQLFLSKKHPERALKRWLARRFDDMPKSLKLLDNALDLVASTNGLAAHVRVIGYFHPEGTDWIVRDFVQKSVPLTTALKKRDKGAITAWKAAITLLRPPRVGDSPRVEPEVNEDGSTTRPMDMDPDMGPTGSLLSKLWKTSDNLHWASAEGRIVVIDMM